MAIVFRGVNFDKNNDGIITKQEYDDTIKENKQFQNRSDIKVFVGMTNDDVKRLNNGDSFEEVLDNRTETAWKETGLKQESFVGVGDEWAGTQYPKTDEEIRAIYAEKEEIAKKSPVKGALNSIEAHLRKGYDDIANSEQMITVENFAKKSIKKVSNLFGL